MKINVRLQRIRRTVVVSKLTIVVSRQLDNAALLGINKTRVWS